MAEMLPPSAGNRGSRFRCGVLPNARDESDRVDDQGVLAVVRGR